MHTPAVLTGVTVREAILLLAHKQSVFQTKEINIPVYLPMDIHPI